MSGYELQIKEFVLRAVKAETERDALLRMIDSWDVDPDMTSTDWIERAVDADTLGNDGTTFQEFMEDGLRKAALSMGVPYEELVKGMKVPS